MDDAKIAELAKRLVDVEQLERANAILVERLVDAHNELHDQHNRLVKVFNDYTGNAAGKFQDIIDHLHMVSDRAAPGQLAFLEQVERVLKIKPGT